MEAKKIKYWDEEAQMDNKLVSILITNKNKEKFLEKCIDSIYQQTYRPLEVCIFDDGSTDASLIVIKKLKQKYDSQRFHICIDCSAVTIGQSAGRNRAFALSRGQFISTIDSDDVYYSVHKISREMNIMTRSDCENPVVYSLDVRVNSEGNITRFKTLDLPLGEVEPLLRHRKCYVPRDMLISRNLFEKVNGFDGELEYFEDFDFKLRLAKMAPYCFSYSIGTGYRDSKDGISKRGPIYLSKMESKVLWASKPSKLIYLSILLKNILAYFVKKSILMIFNYFNIIFKNRIMFCNEFTFYEKVVFTLHNKCFFTWLQNFITRSIYRRPYKQNLLVIQKKKSNRIFYSDEFIKEIKCEFNIKKLEIVEI